MEAKKPISHLVAGLIIAGILIVSSILISVIGTGTASRPGGGWISYLILIGGLVFFINKYGNDRENYASFGELFSYGFKATAMITLTFILFIVGIALLFPEFKEKALEAAQLEMESQKNYKEADVEKGMNLMEKYFWVFMIGATTLGFIIIGCIGSLIGAAITKKRPYNPLDQLDA
jgi:hypothetical protein